MAILSLAIPTNGISEWVFPVLDSIYKQGVDENKFEVVVTDNGNNDDFYREIIRYKKKHNNLIYRKNHTKMFMNQIEAFKLCTGEYIKFVNHKSKLEEGMLNYLIEYVECNSKKKPVTFFLNGAKTQKKQSNILSEFDSFIYELSYNSSWSGGVGCWKSDFDKLLESGNIMRYEGLFPHLVFVFLPFCNREYKIDNANIFKQIQVNETRKGRYDLFYAFGIEYMNAVKNLFQDEFIAQDTYEHIKNDNKIFIENLYAEYVIFHKKCSYDISSAKLSLNQYYSYNEIKEHAKVIAFNRVLRKMKSLAMRK